MAEEKVREDRVRRMLARQGYQLTRSNRRDPRAWDFGVYVVTYMLANGTDTGRLARYCSSLDEVERWAMSEDQDAEMEDASDRPAQDWEELTTITVGANWIAQLGGTAGDGPRLVKVLRHKGDIRFIRLEPLVDGWVRVGEVGIDSGRLLLMEPNYIRSLSGKFLNSRPDSSGISSEGDVAALVTSGLGNGTYPISVKYSDGVISAVRVDFLD
jgi:hypothetical protein